MKHLENITEMLKNNWRKVALVTMFAFPSVCNDCSGAKAHETYTSRKAGYSIEAIQNSPTNFNFRYFN